MKKVYSLLLSAIALLCAFSTNAQWAQVTHFSGTQNYNGVDVTVTSSGSVNTGGGQCLINPDPYWAGAIAPGQYDFNFSTPVASILLTIEGINTGGEDSAVVYINGAQYYLVQCNIQSSYVECPAGGDAAVVQNGVIYGPAAPADYGGTQLLITPPGGINSFSVVSSGAVAGTDFYVSISTNPNPVTGNVVATDFITCIGPTCSGATFTVNTPTAIPSGSMETFFGDGQSTTVPVSLGNTVVNHAYAFSGVYTIKQILFTGPDAIDSTEFSYEFTLCNNFAIKYYLDSNNNCLKDYSESYLSLPVVTEVDSNNVPIDTITSIGGFYYTAYGNAGDVYQFRVLSSGGVQPTCPGTGIITDTIQSMLYNSVTNYIGFNCTTGTDFDLSVSGVFHAGRHTGHGFIIADNYYCTPENATVSAVFSNKYSFTDATPPATTQSANNISWDVTGLALTTNAPTSIEYNVDVPATWLTDGDTVSSSFAITPTVGDLNIADNNEVIIDTVDGSWDPNFMSVSPGGHILPGTKLLYGIEFENTGHDTAFNIHVMDTLSDNVDIKTLKFISSSATMNTSVVNMNGHNIIKFDFPHINLLDSSHHGKCDGLLMYSINAKEGLPFGTTIFNKAGIYFDDNVVVMTNRVEDIIGWPESVPGVANSNEVKIYPNPASNELNIKTSNANYTAYTITNSIGQVMMQQGISSTQTKVDITTLPAGIYYISLKNSDGNNMVRKFVKM